MACNHVDMFRRLELSFKKIVKMFIYLKSIRKNKNILLKYCKPDKTLIASDSISTVNKKKLYFLHFLCGCLNRYKYF